MKHPIENIIFGIEGKEHQATLRNGVVMVGDDRGFESPIRSVTG